MVRAFAVQERMSRENSEHVHRLCILIYQEGSDRIKTRAMLCQVSAATTHCSLPRAALGDSATVPQQ